MKQGEDAAKMPTFECDGYWGLMPLLILLSYPHSPTCFFYCRCRRRAVVFTRSTLSGNGNHPVYTFPETTALQKYDSRGSASYAHKCEQLRDRDAKSFQSFPRVPFEL